MPVYLTEPSLLTEVRALSTRIARLEQKTDGESVFDTGSTGTSGGGTPTGDYVARSGDTMTGALTLQSTLTGTTAHFTGNVTVDGTLTTATGGFANDSDVVHLVGAETVSGAKTFTAEQKFSAAGAYTDPDPGVTRAIKIGHGGLAVHGEILTDGITTTNGLNVTGGTITTPGLTSSGPIVANGGFDLADLLDLTRAAGTLAAVGTGIGDKIGLYSTTYGIGVQTDRLVLHAASGGGVSVRQASSSGQASSGTDAHTFLSTGNASHIGSLTVGNGFTLSAGVVTAPVGSINGSTLVKDTITGVGSSSGTGIGHLAPLTVGTDNIANASVTSGKLSLGAVATTNIALGTLRDSSSTMFRTATASTTDAAGQPIGGLTLLSGATRVTDSQAFDGVAIQPIGISSSGVSGPAYTALLPGRYRVTVYLKMNWTPTAAQPAFSISVNGTNIVENLVANAFTGATVGAVGAYYGYSCPMTLIGTTTLNVKILNTGAVNGGFSVSHVTVEPWDGLTLNEVQTQYIKDLAITNAKVNDMSVSKLIAGTINVDDIFLGTGGHIYAGITSHPGALTGRVELASGGLFGYDGTQQTFALTNTGLSLKGSIQSGSSITGTTITGTTGLTVGTGNNVFIAGSNGIQLGHATFGSAPFRVTTTGALTATNATIQGNMTAGTISGVNITASNTIDGAAIIAGTFTATAAAYVGVDTSAPLNTNGDLSTAGGTQQTPPGWTLGAGGSSGAPSSYGRVADPDNSSNWVYLLDMPTGSGSSVGTGTFAVSAGQVYEISCAVRASVTNGPIIVRAYFSSSSPANDSSMLATGTQPATTVVFGNGPIGNGTSGFVDIASNMFLPANSWQPIKGYVTVPSGAAYMQIALYAWVAPQGWSAHFDELKVAQRTGGTSIVKDAISTQFISATQFSGQTIRANTINVDRLSSGTMNATSFVQVGDLTNGLLLDARTGSQGFRLYGGGIATVNLDAATGAASFTGTLNVTGASTLQSTLTVTGTITGSGVIQGPTFRTASSGTRIEIDTSNGIRGFSGSTQLLQITTAGVLTADSASLTNATFTGTVTGSIINGATITGGVFQSSASTPRVQIAAGNAERIDWYTGNPYETFASSIGGGYDGSFYNQVLTLSSGSSRPGGSGTATIQVRSQDSGGAGVPSVYINCATTVNARLTAGSVQASCLNVFGNEYYGPNNPPPVPSSTSGSFSANGLYDSGYRVYSPLNPQSIGYIGYTYLNDAPLYIRASGDGNHYLNYNGGINGPQLIGYNGVSFGNQTWGANKAYLQGNEFHTDSLWYVSIHASSAEATKSSIAALPHGLESLRKFQPVRYKNKKTEGGMAGDFTSWRASLVAEDVEKIMPEAVTADVQGVKGYDVNYVIMTLINAVKELDAKVSTLSH